MAPAEPEHSAESVLQTTLPRTAPRPRRQAAGRDLWLRASIFAVLLGAVLTILYAWFLAPADAYSAATAVGVASFQRVLVPILAATALTGVLVLERAPVLGVVLMVLGTGLGWAGGAAWLLPGAVLGCFWAAHRHAGARATLGFLLLLPGVAAVYYALLAAIAYSSDLPVRGLPPQWAQPATLAQALQPLEWLPLALVGAWLLVRPLRRNA